MRNNTVEKSPETPIWQQHSVNLSDLPLVYMQLGKSRLSSLVVVTSLGGYGAAALSFGNFSLLSFSACLSGVYLTAFCANTLNQCLEMPYDAQMKRTQNRVLPRCVISIEHAATFGLISGSFGRKI